MRYRGAISNIKTKIKAKTELIVASTVFGLSAAAVALGIAFQATA